MPEYTVRDTATNKTITFRWNAPQPPTDADMEEIFAAAAASQEDVAPAAQMTSGAPTGAPAVAPSAMGFATNVVKSGAQFAENIATPLVHPVETVKGLASMARQPGLTAKLVAEAIKKRYGSYDALLKTAYEDPTGMASDLSIVLGGAATAAKAAGLPKAAMQMSRMGEAVNPLAIPAKVGQTAGRAAYGAAINPSRRIRRGFPGAVEEGYQRNILPTEKGLGRVETALEQSAAKTQKLLKQADAAGAPRVTAKQITPALAEPMEKARLRTKLGVPDERPALVARAKTMKQQMAFGQQLEAANTIKREAQTLADSAFRAQERGALIKDLDALANQRVAQAYRKAIEVNAASVGVEGIAESNRRTQSLIGLAQALEEATHQPSRLTHLMATLGGVGGGAAAGSVGIGAAAYGIGRIATLKPVMAGAGLAMGKSAKVIRNAQIVRALAVLKASTADIPQEQTR